MANAPLWTIQQLIQLIKDDLELHDFPNTITRIEDYAFDGWYNKRSSIVSYLTIIASIVTIIGIISIFGSMRRNVISRSCQRRIIIDLIRHFFVNMAIVEAVIHQLKKKKILFCLIKI